jgi:hypothetical protein
MNYNLYEQFKTITSRFDLDDWRTVRNEDYWESDKIKDSYQRLSYKMRRIMHYDKHGVILIVLRHKVMIIFNDFKCEIQIEKYHNGNKVIRLVDAEDGMPVAVATTNVEGLQPDEIAIKDYSENEGMYETLVKAGVISPMHKEIEQGWVRIPICKLIDEYVI